MDFTNHQIDIEQLPKMQEVEYLPPEEKYINVLRINYLLLWGIPLIASVVWFFLTEESKTLPIIGISTSLLLLITMQILVKRVYHFRGYALREKDICQRTGIFFHKYSTIPFRRIQHLSVEQGPIARIFHLSSLHVYTAAGEDNSIVLKGITQERANEMKAFILNTIKEDADN